MNFGILIENKETRRVTFYKPSELLKDARHMVKGKGKLTSYHVAIMEPSGIPQLVATYMQSDGWSTQVSQVI